MGLDLFHLGYALGPKRLRREVLQGIDRIIEEKEYDGQDPAKWLEATVPALKGPFADRTWVKHVLREIISL
ncbi:MAG TPA: hypothetical protein GX507_11810 [Clostridia bacterium]|nr:hypothetical protein [Clostridia bacterium]